MRKLFVSVPMKGRTEEKIRASIEKMKKIAEAYEGEELELIDSYIEDIPPKSNNQAIWYLGKSLEKMADADVFIGIDDAYEWDGCYVENTVAGRYGIKCYRVPAEIAINNYRELMEERYSEKSCAPAPR